MKVEKLCKREKEKKTEVKNENIVKKKERKTEGQTENGRKRKTQLNKEMN